jgi:hypothetical protein
MSGTDRDPPPPPTDPTDPGAHTTDGPGHASNVVPITAGAGRRKPKPATAMPSSTGVSAMSGDPALDNLRASCLTDATIEAARFFTLPSTKWKPYGFRSARPQTGLFIPFFAPGAAEPFSYRLRPQYPLPTKRKGKLKKYAQPYESDLLVYTPPLPATCDHLRDAAAPLVWTEGEKKALLLAQLGWCVVGLTGVDCWIDTDAKSRGDGRALHPYIREHYAVAGRAHVIVFDADARSNMNVMQAAQRLAGVLVAAGAISVHLCLPPDGGRAKGIDDYAAEYGVDAAQSLLTYVRDPIEEIAPDLGCVPLAHYGRWFEGSGAERLRMPRGYECERDGSLWHTPDITRPDEKVSILDSPIVIARQLANLYSGELRTDVRFRDARGAWRSAIVPREVLGDRGLVSALRPLGALVNAGTSPATMRYLDAFERDNGSLIERVQCVGQTGWHAGQFVTGGTPIMRDAAAHAVVLDGSADLMRVAAAVQPAAGAVHHGHVEALRVPLMASPECALAIYAALAAPLLHMLGVGNFAVHLCGDSSRGKTSMLRIAASVFGDPYNAQWVASWNATLTGLEQRAALLCDLPQCYDEIGSADFDQVQRMMYSLINGEGRTRSGRDVTMRSTASWRTVVLSTGEAELATEQDATGAQARVLSVPVLGFGELDAAEIEESVRACARHHGAVGRAWLEYLVGMPEHEVDHVRACYRAMVGQLRHEAAGDRLAQRTSAYYAALAVAETLLASVWGLGRPDGGTVFAYVRERVQGDDGARVKPLAERVTEALQEWLQSSPQSFPDGTAPVAPDLPRVAGYRLYDGEVAFLPTRAAEYLRDKRLPLTRAVRAELVSAGVLIPGTGARASRTSTRIPINGRHVVVLKVRFPDPQNVSARGRTCPNGTPVTTGND